MIKLVAAGRGGQRSRPVRLETIQIRLPADLLQWIDEFRDSIKIPPSRSEAIRYLIEQGRKSEEQQGG